MSSTSICETQPDADSQILLERWQAELGLGDFPATGELPDTLPFVDDAQSDVQPATGPGPEVAHADCSTLQAPRDSRLYSCTIIAGARSQSARLSRSVASATGSDAALPEPRSVATTTLATTVANGHVPGDRDVTVKQSPPRRLRPSPTVPGSKVHVVSMDTSQDSPTQLNDDRLYGEEPSLDLGSSHGASDRNADLADPHNRSLQPDDLGAVNFGDIDDPDRPSSQVSEDAGFGSIKAGWRRTDNTSQLLPSNGYTPFKTAVPVPETPALPRNPFAARPNVGVPYGGTQMFGQTQFSSAMKKASPTSSRPSPNAFLNSASPNIMETSPLKNRTNVSSPSDIRSSSPGRQKEAPGTTRRRRHVTLSAIDEASPYDKAAAEDAVPESPSRARPRSSGLRGPLTHYESVQKSQERKSSPEVLPIVVDDDDNDPNDAIRRMNRLRRLDEKLAKASDNMSRIRYTPPSSRDTQGGKPRKRRRVLSDEDPPGLVQHISASAREVGAADGENIPTTMSSGDVIVDSSKAAPGTAPNGQSGATRRREPIVLNGDDAECDVVPATSPMHASPSTCEDAPVPASEPELPPMPDLVNDLDAPEPSKETSPFPSTTKRPRVTYRGRNRLARRKLVITSSASEGPAAKITASQHDAPGSSDGMAAAEIEVETPQKRAAIIVAAECTDEAGAEATTSDTCQKDVQAPPRPISTAQNQQSQQFVTPRKPRASSEGSDMSSSLSVLSKTPTPSSKTSPEMHNSPGSTTTGHAENPPSSGHGRNLRKRPLAKVLDSASSRRSHKVLRHTKSRSRLGSESTDELQLSPSASAMGHSTAQVRPGRTFRQSMALAQRSHALFEGMAFAISFSSDGVKQPGRADMESKITQAGGTVFQSGFHELFERSSVVKGTSPVFDQLDALQLTERGSQHGFTALIADEHSRKAKYMEALALGLPCLAHQWVTMCLEKETLVDWQPYLLCAGASAVLGNAVRSRILSPYPAVSAELPAVVERRQKLLDGQKILIMVDSKKSRNEAKQPYIFLAQTLGGSISRVFTTKQAKEELSRAAKRDEPYNWVYVDQASGSVEAVLWAVASGSAAIKKKYRPPMEKWAEGIRVLDDELVIQSLILGRMADAGEM